MTDKSFSETWLEAVHETIRDGRFAAPRGQDTYEILQRTIEVNMRKPVLLVPDRKLSYQFMAAEAYWILSGDNSVAGIAPWNKHISQFSDNGTTFFGAYGPRIVSQLEYVVNKLVEDQDTRQAGLTIWHERPPRTKDTPCTIAVFFNIRGLKLNVSVYMRSSDIWLGVPYDVFNFSMLGHLVAGLVNELIGSTTISPGTLYLTAASSHLYHRNLADAENCLRSCQFLQQLETPQNFYEGSSDLLEALKTVRDSKPGDEARWWEYKEKMS